MQRFEEMRRSQLHGQILDDSVVDQDRAQKGGLGLDIAGQLAFVPGRNRGRKKGKLGHGSFHASKARRAQSTISINLS
jgi:hypothetical protein